MRTPKVIPGTLPGPLYVVFDGPPSHEAPRFVELEDAGGCGHGSDVGVEWDESEEFYRLGPFYSEMQLEGAIGLVRRPLMEALAAIVEKEPPDDWEPYPYAGEYRMPDGSGIDDSNSGDVHTHGVELGAWSVAKQIRAALKAAEETTA